VKLAGDYAFEAPLDVVWQALFDPEVLARTLPGCERLDREGDGFVGELNVKMGPVQGKFQGKVDISNVVAREGYTMVIDGRGPAGFVKAKAVIQLTAEGEATRLGYDSDVTVGGRIASVGQRLIDASSKAILKQSLEGLHAQVKALAAQASAAADAGNDSDDVATGERQPGAGEPAAPAAAVAGAGASPAGDSRAAGAPRERAAAGAAAAPSSKSQAAFALGVAREVTRELLPVKTVALVLALLVAAWLAYRSFS
jgi:carbon monoxide dehydrogenase subunit G